MKLFQENKWKQFDPKNPYMTDHRRTEISYEMLHDNVSAWTLRYSFNTHLVLYLYLRPWRTSRSEKLQLAVPTVPSNHYCEQAHDPFMRTY